MLRVQSTRNIAGATFDVQRPFYLINLINYLIAPIGGNINLILIINLRARERKSSFSYPILYKQSSISFFP